MKPNNMAGTRRNVKTVEMVERREKEKKLRRFNGDKGKGKLKVD